MESFILMTGFLCLMMGILKNQVVEEAHKSQYLVHPSSTKMYRDRKKIYWWPGMKTEIVEFV